MQKYYSPTRKWLTIYNSHQCQTIFINTGMGGMAHVWAIHKLK